MQRRMRNPSLNRMVNVILEEKDTNISRIPREVENLQYKENKSLTTNGFEKKVSSYNNF